VEKIKLSGLGMLTKWSPQQFILNHPVIIYLLFLLVLELNKINLYRLLDGLLRIAVSMASLNLLGAAFPCKPFFSRYTTQFNLLFFR
jgi:hypothetical protein